MKENYWIIGELESESFKQQQEQKLNKFEESQPDENEWHRRASQVKLLPQSAHDSINNNTNTNNININNNNQNNKKNPEDQSGFRHQDDIWKRGSYSPTDEPTETHTRQKASDKRPKPVEYKREEQQMKRKQQQAKMEENDVNLSFCGCGFLGIYHVGVASCFHEYAPQLSMHKIAGSSAGALVAVAHICGNLQLAYATTDILRVAIDARARALGPFHPSFDINAIVREALERGLPDDVHLKASGKLHVSLTRVYDGENVIISEFDSKEDVIQVLLCSCFIPFWSGLVAPKYKGVTYIDGGFSNNLLILDDKTVTVSPFAGETDICPQDDTFNLLQVSLSNTSFSLSPNNLYRLSNALLPPPPEVLSNLCEQGFADGIRFLQRMKLISCTKCLEIRSSLLVTTNGEDMEEAFEHEVQASELHHQDHHIRLEQQEQKMIEIDGSKRRSSVVSTTSQKYLQQSASSSYLFHEGLMDDQYLDSCDECVLMRQKALCDPLPKHFTDRVSKACDSVNKSLSNWIYSHKPIKYLSYLAAPYYLPVDISLALIYKCWQKLPLIRSEFISCMYNLVEFLIGIVKRMQAKSTSTILMGLAGSEWEGEETIEYEKEVMKRQKSSQSIHSGCYNLHGIHNKDSTANATTSPDRNSLESSYSLKITTDGVCVSKLRNASSTHLHSLEDTFDSIVDVTSNQEARILAYYFRDAKNRLQVTEIFDLQRAAGLSGSSQSINQSHTPTNHNPSSAMLEEQPVVTSQS